MSFAFASFSFFSLADQAAQRPKHVPADHEYYKLLRLERKLFQSSIVSKLFFPAMSAMTHNKLCKTFAARLEEKGKKRIVILGAVMTKLLHLIFGILRSGKPFDPDHQGPIKMVEITA